MVVFQVVLSVLFIALAVAEIYFPDNTGAVDYVELAILVLSLLMAFGLLLTGLWLYYRIQQSERLSNRYLRKARILRGVCISLTGCST